MTKAGPGALSVCSFTSVTRAQTESLFKKKISGLRSNLGLESACSAGDPGPILGSGISPEEGNGNQLQDSTLGNSMDRRAWQPTVQGVAKSRTQLTNTFTFKVNLRY